MGRGVGDRKRSRKGKPRNNQRQNEQTRTISKELNLTPEQREVLKRAVEEANRVLGEDWGFQDILRYAKKLFR